jgi:hypothetical protein
MRDKDKLRVGDLVIVTVSFLGAAADSIGLVYDDYKDGVSIIVIYNGCDLGGFSHEEIDRYLIKIGHFPEYADYGYGSVMKLYQDYENGYFQTLVQYVKELARI